MRRDEEGPAIFGGLISGLLPYRQMASDLVKTGSAFTNRLIPQLVEYQENTGEVEMVMDQYASWIAWEAILAQAQQRLLPEAPACRFRRTLTKRKHRSLPPWQKHIASLVWACEFAHENMAQSVWSDLGWVSIVKNDVSRTQPPLEDMEIKAQILHIIGPPQETSSGIRLDMAGQKRARQLSKTSGRGNLIRADMITGQFPELKLCILQAPPDDEITTRSSDDREKSACLRLLGAELFNLGVPAVITIPSLPMNVSEKLLLAFAQSLHEHFRQGSTPPASTPLMPGPRELLGSMYGAQQIVQNWKNIDPQLRMEMSLDFCLYADDERYWRL